MSQMMNGARRGRSLATCRWNTCTMLIVLYVVVACVQGQDDFGDDSEGGGEIVDMESLMGGDRKEGRYIFVNYYRG